MSDKINKILFFLIVILSLSIYILGKEYNYIGYFNDDAWYINAARYLAGVQTDYKQLEGRPLGYPLILVPLAKLFPGKISVFRYPSIFFIISVSFFLFYFLKDIFKDKSHLLLFIALLNLNPFFVSLSSDVLSEAPYLFFTFLCLVVLKKYLRKREDKSVLSHFLLALPLACMFYIRSQGLLLFAAIFIYFLFKKKNKELLYLTFFYLIFVLPLILKGSVLGSPLDKYMGEVGETYSASSVLSMVAGNFIFYIKQSIFPLLFGIHETFWDSSVFTEVLITGVSCIVLIIMAYIMIKDREKDFLNPVKIYLLLYFFMHIFWVNVSDRYIIPVLPFLLYYFLKWLIRFKKKYVYLCSGLLFVSYMYKDFAIIKTSIQGAPNSPGNPVETFEWINMNTPKDALFLSTCAERLYLVSNRKCLYVFEKDRDILYYKAMDTKAGYVVYFSGVFLQKSHQYSVQKAMFRRVRYFLKDCSRYRVVYENKKEDTAVLKVIEHKEFIKAWKLYKNGIKKFNEGNLIDAEDSFKKALVIYTDFTSAASNLASIYLMKNDYEKALEIIEKSLKLYPKSGVMWALRGKVYSLKGDREKAMQSWKKAKNRAGYLYDFRLTSDIMKDMEKNLTN